MSPREPKAVVVLCAGAWGFGPVTTAAMLAVELRGEYAFVFKGEGVAAEYVRSHLPWIEPIESWKDLDRLRDSIIGLISVVEAEGVLWAHSRAIPIVALDNLFWHWEWNEGLLDRVCQVLANVSGRTSSVDVVNAIGKEGRYAEYALPYLLADEVVWQRVAIRPEGSAKWLRGRWVEPLVPQVPPRAVVRPSALVSFSGGLINPFASEADWSTYVRLIGAILNPLHLRAHYYTIAAAPVQLHDLIRKHVAPDVVRTFSHEEFLDQMSRASVLMAPAGLATTFEAAAGAVPLITLPEQHDGNHANYLGLAEAAGITLRELEEGFPSSMLSTFDASYAGVGADHLFRRYAQALEVNSDPFVEFGRRAVKRGLESATLVQQQGDVVRSFAGGMQGCRESADIARRVFAAKATRRPSPVGSFNLSTLSFAG